MIKQVRKWFKGFFERRGQHDVWNDVMEINDPLIFRQNFYWASHFISSAAAPISFDLVQSKFGWNSATPNLSNGHPSTGPVCVRPSENFGATRLSCPVTFRQAWHLNYHLPWSDSFEGPQLLKYVHPIKLICNKVFTKMNVQRGFRANDSQINGKRCLFIFNDNCFYPRTSIEPRKRFGIESLKAKGRAPKNRQIGNFHCKPKKHKINFLRLQNFTTLFVSSQIPKLLYLYFKPLLDSFNG